MLKLVCNVSYGFIISVHGLGPLVIQDHHVTTKSPLLSTFSAAFSSVCRNHCSRSVDEGASERPTCIEPIVCLTRFVVCLAAATTDASLPSLLDSPAAKRKSVVTKRPEPKFSALVGGGRDGIFISMVYTLA